LPSRSSASLRVPASVLSSLDITQQLLERSLGRAPAVVHGFLEFLRLNSALLGPGEANRQRIRDLAKFLNLTGGVCVLDCLSESEVIRTLQREQDNMGVATAAPVAS
jgi:hypothetical protein